jgi:prepilin signal peptidase PulO-like enzyme (type II secretory pathway)
MMNNTVWISLVLGFTTMALLYLIGFIANIDILIFKVTHSNTEIAFLPIIIGLLVILISGRMMKSTN